MVDFLMMFSLCICVLSGVTLLIVHIGSKKKQKKEEQMRNNLQVGDEIIKQEVLFFIAGRRMCQSP